MGALPAAVIFDLDGTLLDSETPEYESWREIYASRGRELGPEDFARVVGVRGWDLLQPILVPGEDPADLLRRQRRRSEELILRFLRPQPGVQPLLDELEGAGVPLGVASTSDAAWVEEALRRLDLRRRFAAVAGGDEVRRAKPDPAVYLLAARRLGVEARRAVAVEDSAPGARAARAAGMAVLVVPNRFTRHHDLSAADEVVGSLAEVSLDRLASLLARASAA